MPPDLTIGSTPPQAHAPAALESARAAAPVAARGFAQVAAASPAAITTNASTPAVPANRVVLDPASDRVVLEYFDSTGALVNSLPSQRQLDAYRLAASAAADHSTHIKKP